MQNSNTILVKNSASPSLIGNTNGNKSEVNALSSVESPNSFQQMFSQQIQQEQANNAANQKQVNQAQTSQNLANQNLANQQANMKAQEANQVRARDEQKNVQKAQERNADQASAANQADDKKSKSITISASGKSANTQKTGDTTTTSKSNAKDTDNADPQNTETEDKKITIDDLSTNLKLAKLNTKLDGASQDETTKDETKDKIDKKDISLEDSLQATALAGAQLAAQKSSVEMTKPEEKSVAIKTGADAVGVNLAGAEKTQKSAHGNQVDADLTLDQTSANSLGEKTDVAKQAWLDGAMGKAASNVDKAAASFAEKMAETALQANIQLNSQAKVTEQLTAPASNASVNAYQATANVLNITGSITGSSNYIAASPGKSGWDQAISQKVLWMVGASEQSATLNLNPPDLGPLQVVINVNNDKADTTFISQNVEVRKALEEGMSTLRDMMGQAGVELGQTNVSTNSQAQQSFEQASKNSGQSFGSSGIANQAPETVLSSKVVTRSANGLVDTFA